MLFSQWELEKAKRDAERKKLKEEAEAAALKVAQVAKQQLEAETVIPRLTANQHVFNAFSVC
jgi:hypothetical protein